MRTIIIGGGKGCQSLLSQTTRAYLKEFKIDIRGVVDNNPNAPGMIYADEIGLKTFQTLSEALISIDVEQVLELTGDDDFLNSLYKELKPGIKIIDHTFARIFWDLLNSQEKQKWQLEELERLEIKIEKEKHFLQSIFDSYADYAVVLDKKMRIIRANEKFLKFTNFTEKNIIGKKISDVLKKTELEDNYEESRKIIDNVLSSGMPKTSIHLANPKFETNWEIIRTPIFEKNGIIESILCTWHRITNEVLLKQQVKSAENILKGFINSAQDWISIKDINGRYVIVNPAIASAFDLKPDDFTGKKPEEILPIKQSETIKKNDKEVIETKRHHTYDELIPVLGHEHTLQTTRFPLTDYLGEIIGVCTIARDKTNEVRLQEQLVQSEKLAAIGKLAAGVAHEINNPLTGILAYTEDIIDSIPEDDPHREDLKVILRETLRCREIVRNLLDFARQDKPKFEINDVNKIVEDSVSLIVKLPQFKDITINNKLIFNLPKIQSDPNQLQQVILNLLLNSADAMKNSGEINIYTDYDRDNRNCIIAVEDTGTGVPDNLKEKIFEPFFSTKGTSGLGLAVSWGIIERHQGTILIESSVSGGAIFKIVLPVFH